LRQEFYDCLARRADVLVELVYAALVAMARHGRWSGCHWRPSVGAGTARFNGRVASVLRNLVRWL
jgi:hypothetical protein